MIGRIWAVGVNTFREAVRARILYAMAFAAVALIGFAVALNHLSVGQEGAILIDMGVATVSIFAVLVSIVLGIGLVYSEVEQRTIFTILSKPVARWEFLAGKFLGLNLTVGLMTAVMSAGFLGLAKLMGAPVGAATLAALGFVYVEALVITSVAILFSAFSTPYLSGFFAFGVFFIGHLSDDIRAFGEHAGVGQIRLFTEALYRVLPNLEYLNLKNQALADALPTAPELAMRASYGALYAAAVLLIAMGVFSRRDFK